MSKDDDIKYAKLKILEAIEKHGLYSNNVVGSILRGISKKYDIATSDSLVVTMGLERLIGIAPVSSPANKEQDNDTE